jgi:hypothetical protein
LYGTKSRRIVAAVRGCRIAAAATFVLLVAGCGDSSTQLTLKERLLPASSFDGYYPARTFDWAGAEGPAGEGFGLVRATPDQAHDELEKEGFVHGVGELLQNARQEHYPVIILRFHTQQQAEAVGAWEQRDLLLPCREACNTRISKFTVDGIPGSGGVDRVVGAQAPNGPTVDRWIVTFVKGPVLYIVERSADIGTLKNGHDDVVKAAKLQYARVKDATFPSS